MTEPAGRAGIPPQDTAWEDLLDSGPARAPGEAGDAVARSLGLDVPRRRPAGIPPVDGLREQMGI